MKPDWKGCAKKAYEEKESACKAAYDAGYEAGIRHGSEWIPAMEEKPKRNGTYICLCFIRNLNGSTGLTRCMAEYQPGMGWLCVPGNLPVAYWMEAPPVPKIEVSIVLKEADRT